MSKAETLAAIHARLLRDRSLQFDIHPPLSLPSRPEPTRFDWQKAIADVVNPLVQAIAKALAPAMGPIFWVCLALVGLLILWLVVREVLGLRLARARKSMDARPAPADWRPDPLRARALLENADRLAAQGRFDLAVRLILHRGVEDIDERRPRLVRPALTAREIAGLDAVPGPARIAFTRIAAVVEFSAFAGQPIGRSAFDQCRADYEAFAISKAWT